MKVRLLSTKMVHTPGLIEWARNLGSGDFDPDMEARLIRIGFLAYTYNQISGRDAVAIEEGKYTVEDDMVIVETEGKVETS